MLRMIPLISIQFYAYIYALVASPVPVDICMDQHKVMNHLVGCVLIHVYMLRHVSKHREMVDLH